MAISDIASRQAEAPKKGPDCTVCAALDQLPPNDAAGLTAMLSDPRRRYSEIEALIAADKDTPDWIRAIAANTYARHAKGACYPMRAAGLKLR